MLHLWHLATDFACKNCADSGKASFTSMQVHAYALIVSSSLHGFLALLHFVFLLFFFFACRENCTAMLGFLLFFACRERIALLVCLDSCSSLLHTQQCHLWLNCTAVLGFLLFFFACRERIALLYLDSCSTSKCSQSHVSCWKESSAILCIVDKFSSESKDLNCCMRFSYGFRP